MRIHGIIGGTVVAVLLLWNGAVYGQSGTCTPITSVPITITTPGVYCLTGNLTHFSLTAAAITVEASAVVVDFNGYKLVKVFGPALSTGVKVTAQKNVTIRNGLISTFFFGIESSARATVVEDMRLSNAVVGIQVTGVGALVRRNYVRESTYGIWVYGDSARVIENNIVGVPLFGWGIIIDAQDGLVVGNRLSSWSLGITYSASGGTGKYRDNLTTDVAVPYSGGTDAGNNN